MAEEDSGKPARYRNLSKIWLMLFACVTLTGIAISINQIYLLGVLTFPEHSYYYTMLGLFMGFSFIIFPASKGAPRDKVPWYDIVLMLLTGLCSVYMAIHSFEIIDEAWIYTGPPEAVVLSIGLWFLGLEALRRAGGMPLFIFSLLFSFFPLFAEYMPGFLEGTGWSFTRAASVHAMSSESLIGIPTRVICDLLIGFMVFGVALQTTGGGKFFIDLAFSFLGSVRGGPAKVSIFASALFGSMSGAVLSNVVTTGSMTIPAMKKAGYPPYYAGAVEAAASTGGCIMPPVMGTVAFIMASFLGVPYSSIAIGAAVPAILYFWTLFVQIDAYAGRTGLIGVPRSELPSLKQTLREGWVYILAIAALVYLLFFLRRVAQAPYYSTILLIAGAMLRKETRFNVRSFLLFVAQSGRLLSELFALLAAIGLIIGGLVMTGVALSFSSELISAVGGNVIALLLIAALASFILGMGMTISACYIFLVFMVVPALVPFGFDIMAIHLFVVYCGLMSFITPPVAIAAYAASNIAESPPMKTGFEAMKLGVAKFFVPFFFILDPALILHAPLAAIAHATSTALIGFLFIGSSLEGYLVGFGRIGILNRVIIFAAGFLLAFPGSYSDLAGGALALVAIAIKFLKVWPWRRAGRAH